MVQTTTSIMRSGRFAVLVGLVAVVTAVVLARAQRDPLSDDEGRSAPIPPPSPAAVTTPAVPAPVAAAPAEPQRVAWIRSVARPARRDPPGDPFSVATREEEAWIRIEDLVYAGDMGRARDFAEEFLRLYPYSDRCQRIETLTGVHPRPAIPGE
jgi:hypothetical protein